MPRLPGPANVPQVSPPRQAQVAAPAAAFGAAENEALTGFADTAARVVDQRLSRIEAMNHARAENALIERSQQKLLELNSEKDLSMPDTQAEYADWLDQQKEELLGQFGGRSKQQAFLLRNLDNTAARFRGRANALAEEISLQNLDQALSRQLSTYQRTAESDPARVVDLMNEWQQQVRNVYGPAMPPGMESASLVAGQEQIVKAALRPFLTTGDVGSARELLSQYSPLLPEESVAELGGYIREQAAEQDEIIGWVQTMRSMGYEPTYEQILAKSGALPPSSGVTVNVGGEGGMAPILSKDEQAMIVPEPDGTFRRVPIAGTEEASEAIQRARAPLAAAERTQQELDVATYGVERIFDIIEEAGGGTGPIEGRIGQYNPLAAASRMEPFIQNLKSMVVRDTMEQMRASSAAGATGFGAMNEKELAIVEAAKGSLDPRMEERDLFTSLLRIVEGQAKAAFGTDEEIDLAEEQGRLTPAQAVTYAQARDEVINDFRQRSQRILQQIEGKKEAAPAAQPQPAPEEFSRVLEDIRANPTSRSPEEVAGMGFTPQQLIQIGEVYEDAMAAQDPTLQQFIATNPDATQYAAEMAAFLESGQAATLEDAYRMARGGNGE